MLFPFHWWSQCRVLLRWHEAPLGPTWLISTIIRTTSSVPAASLGGKSHPLIYPYYMSASFQLNKVFCMVQIKDYCLKRQDEQEAERRKMKRDLLMDRELQLSVFKVFVTSVHCTSGPLKPFEYMVPKKLVRETEIEITSSVFQSSPCSKGFWLRDKYCRGQKWYVLWKSGFINSYWLYSAQLQCCRLVWPLLPVC